MARVLVIDDDEKLNGFLTRSLTRLGFDCASALDGVEAIELMKQRTFDVLVCDWKMERMDGLEVLRHTTNLDPAPSFIMITGHAGVQVAVDAMKLGASDFLEKPVSVDELQARIRGAVNRNRALPPKVEQPKPSPPGNRLVGSSRWLDPFMELLRRIAHTDTIVLLEGETGTGKSAVAREIWRHSRRADTAFIELNCGAIPDNLVERELFGNERGAYTGADEAHRGKVNQAEEGTLFLDEIGELPILLQPKLLHLLSERSYTPLGSTESQTANVRFIAATNLDLQHAVEEGRFRPDLYFRLNVMRLRIPPLRERTDDIPVLADHFRHEVAARVGHDCPAFSAEAMRLLTTHSWPGNVRELENLVEMMAIMVGPDRPVEADDLPNAFRDRRGGTNHQTGAPRVQTEEPPAPAATTNVVPIDLDTDLKQAVIAYERAMIVAALKQDAGNRTQAAKRLGVKRTTLIEKINRFNIESSEYDDE